jgi:predicted DNA-binding transcriptional regulator YafY
MHSSDRRTALSRLFKILFYVHSNGRLTQQDLAAACGCSDRQIRRDLDTLAEASILIKYDRKQKRYEFVGDWLPFSLELNLTEMLALLLARQAIAGREGMPFAHSAETVFEKIAGLLPSSLQKELASGEELVAFQTAGRRNYSEAPWGQLMEAIRKRQRLEMEYYTISTDIVSTRDIDPYYIVWLQNYCHLIAYCHRRKCTINFALDGIRKLKPTGETFPEPSGFSLAEYLKGASGPVLGDPVEIIVRFAPKFARYAERRVWEFPHQLNKEPDGSLLLRGTVRGLADIRKELLAWGGAVEALAPEELRHELLNQARAIVAIYATAEK